MNTLAEGLRYDAWANHTVIATFRQAPPLLETVCYDGEPLRERARHLLGTGRAFLDVVRRDPQYPDAPQELEALLAYGDATWAELVARTAPLAEADFDEPFFVPWFEREVPLHVIVSQVLAHSAQHRAELAWELARAGVSTGEIDFIQWLVGGRPLPGEAPDLPWES